MNKSTLKLIFAAALLASPTVALAQPTQQARCTTDSLDINQAVARLEWARKCGLTLNTGMTPNTGNPDNWFDSTFFDTSFNPAKEYQENNPNRAYSGNSNTYYVNYWHTWGLYPATPVYTVFKETSGPTTNFWKWSRPTLRPRPLYPSFDTIVTGTGTQLFPHPSLATPPLPWQTVNCNLYTDQAGTTQWTGNFYVSFYCESSCYTPDQSLLFSKGEVNILEAMKAKRDDVVTLTPDATLDDLATQTSRVFSYTAEIRDAEQVIYKIRTVSGGSLSVTNEHPIITSEGRLVKAESLAAGDELLHADGTPDPIVAVEKTKFFGKVYNIKPVSTEPVANILIAQGYLVGSARFQNDDVGYMNRILLFRGVPDDIMPK
jgi:hypothetical protein